MNSRRYLTFLGALLLILASTACGSSAVTPPPSEASGTTRAAGRPTEPRPAPGPPERPCAQPTSSDDVRLGTKVIVEATIAKGAATTDNAGASVIAMQDVKVLWSLASDQAAPTTLSASQVAVADADVLLEPGRYVLLLGSSTPGVYYLAQGREGAFAYVDERGSVLTRLCTVYGSDGTAQAAKRAPGIIARATLLDLSISAAKSDPASS